MGQKIFNLLCRKDSVDNKLNFSQKEQTCNGCGKKIESHVVRECQNGVYFYWCSFKCFTDNK